MSSLFTTLSKEYAFVDSPPHLPSKSAIADTAITSGKLAGTFAGKHLHAHSLPDDISYTTCYRFSDRRV